MPEISEIRGEGVIRTLPSAIGILAAQPLAGGTLAFFPESHGILRMGSYGVAGEAPEDDTVYGDGSDFTLHLVGQSNQTITAIIDHDPLPFSQGTVTEINEAEQWFKFTVDDGYPTPEADWESAKIIPFRNGEMVPCPLNRLDDVIADKYYVDGLGEVLAEMLVGDRVAIPPRTPYHAVSVNGCSNLTLNLQIRSSWNLGVYLVDCDDIVVNVTVESPPDRLLSTNADGVRCFNCNGITANIYVTKCGDDAFNFHGTSGNPEPPAVGRCVGLTLTGKCERNYGAGAKFSGFSILCRDFVAQNNLGVGIHAGEDSVSFDSGPPLEDDEVTIGPGVVLLGNGTTLEEYPSMIAAEELDLDPATEPIVANVTGDIITPVVEEISYLVGTV